MKKKNIDTTSIVMTAVFAVIVIGATVGLLLASINSSKNAEIGNAIEESGFFETDITAENAETPEAETQPEEVVKYETYEELADEFIEICKNGDIDKLYNLYYNDALDMQQQKSGVTKEAFDNNLRSYMVAFRYFDEYPYGSSELLEIKSPSDYVDELHFMAYGEAFPFDVAVQDCVAMRGYLPNGATRDFILAKIDDCWYMAV